LAESVASAGLASPALAEGASDALAILCPARQSLSAAVDAASQESRVAAVTIVALFRKETSCDPRAVNRRTGARGPMQVVPGKSADPDHLDLAEIDDPAVNFRLGALHLRRVLGLCGTLGGALTLYHGRKGAYHGRHRCDVDDWAREVLRAISRAAHKITMLREARS
jgi:hypothetical protein